MYILYSALKSLWLSYVLIGMWEEKLWNLQNKNDLKDLSRQVWKKTTCLKSTHEKRDENSSNSISWALNAKEEEVVLRAPWESEAEGHLFCPPSVKWGKGRLSWHQRQTNSKIWKTEPRNNSHSPSTPTFFFNWGLPTDDRKTLGKQFTKLATYSEIWYWLYVTICITSIFNTC